MKIRVGLAMLVLLICACSVAPVRAQNTPEEELKRTAYHAEFAVLSIWYGPPEASAASQVVGTGFLVTADGYFVTAAHVLEHYQSDPAQMAKAGMMTAGIRQRSGDIFGAPFNLVEKDESHDLALCKLRIALGQFIEHKDNPGTEQPIASLRVSSAEPTIGQFIAIAGFPLGSWTPAIQFGTVAAVRTTNPNAGRVAARQRDLLQISVSGNKGNSGSPVVSLDTGEVIGVIVQAEPAPLFTTSTVQGLPLAQSSGIMLAVPASWVGHVLERHKVQSVAVLPPKGHTSYYPLPEK